ncbi:MAG: type II toxin-antitoxin system RelE/ParE family toxin [Pseudomonadota bacterium]
MKYLLTQTASDNLDEIIRYTDDKFGENQTEEYLKGLTYSFELLSENPFMGKAYDENRRRYLFRMHHVYYKLLPEHILIIEIRNARLAAPD